MKYFRSLKLIVLISFFWKYLYANSTLTITGTLTNKNQIPVAYANLAVFAQKDSSLVCGSTSDQEGNFNLPLHSQEKVFLKISCIGYQSHQIPIDFTNKSLLHLGCIVLQEQSKNIAEVNVIGEKVRVKKGLSSTEYFINRKLQKSSLKSIELLQSIPGIQVDFLQRLSYMGHKNILLLVDGSKRDLSYLQLLDADQIDRIKFTPQAGAEYASEYQSIIHIYLKKKKTDSFSGHLYSEIPTHKDVVYTFPSASFHIQKKALTVRTNYSGEISYFPIHKKNERSYKEGNQSFYKSEKIDQDSWLHRFQTDFNYDFSPNTNLNSHFKWEKSSNIHEGQYGINEQEEGKKRDVFDNDFFLSSLYCSHSFGKAKMNIDLYHYDLRSKSIYRSQNSKSISESESRPKINCFIGKTNVSLPISSKTDGNFGMSYLRKKRDDKSSKLSENSDEVYSFYSECKYKNKAWYLQIGGRFEHQKAKNTEGISQNHSHFTGNLSLKYQLPKKHAFLFHWNQKIQRPNLFELTPTPNFIDEYTIVSGNEDIDVCKKNWMELVWQYQENNQFLSLSVFHHHIKNSIELLRFYPEGKYWKQIWNNTGTINQLGFQVNSNLKLGSKVQFSAQVQLAQSKISPNSLAIDQGAYHQSRYGCKASFSCIYVLDNKYTLNFSLGYSALRERVQYRYYEAPLYSFSVNKEVSKRFNFGLTTVVPFQKKFTHFAKKFYTHNYQESIKDKVVFKTLPVWFRLKYTFGSQKISSPKNRKSIKEYGLKNGG